MNVKKKYYFILSVFSVTLLVFSSIGIKSYAQNLEGYVVEGESLDTIKIGKSTADDVIANYGADYKLINHNRYSYEMIYKKLGLSFYYCQADPNKEIFVVEIEQPFRATTKSGIVLGESTFADVFRIYGKVGKSSSGFEYKGIYFDDEEDDEEETQEDARNQPQIVENTESTNNENETDNPSGFVIDGASGAESSAIVGFENSDIGESNPIFVSETDSNEVETDESENQTDENVQESEADKILKAKIVKRIELIEKSGLRQCESKFPKN